MFFFQNGNTALMAAAQNDYFVVVEDLLAAGARTSIRNMVSSLMKRGSL